jgi:hypothetical protein
MAMLLAQLNIVNTAFHLPSPPYSVWSTENGERDGWDSGKRGGGREVLRTSMRREPASQAREPGGFSSDSGNGRMLARPRYHQARLSSFCLDGGENLSGKELTS